MGQDKETENGKQTENQAGRGAVEAFAPVPEKSPEQVRAEMDAYMAEDHSGKKKKVRKRWSRRKKGTVFFGLMAIILVGARMSAGSGKEVLPVVAAAPLEKGEVTSVLTLNGPVSGTESADVVSNLHSEVLSIAVKEGDRVEKGQTLALIDPTDMQKAVDIAQNTYDLAVSEYNESIRNAQSNYEKAVQDYNAAKLSYDRNQILFNAGDISSADFEAAGNAMQDARRAVDLFTVSNGRAVPDQSYELKVKSAQFELDQKKTDLENTEVKSPISGTVVRVNSKVGQFADKPEDEKPMFIVENLDNLEMEIAVSEYSIGKVKVGQPADISADILDDKKVKGEVISISPTGEEKGSSSERVVPATIRISEGGGGLIAGITARASIETGSVAGVFKVTQTSLISNPDGTYSIAVIDQTDATVHLVPVTLGIESDLEAEIIPVEEGALTEGMMVAVSPVGLTDGMKTALK